jgi:glucosamine 6-phosphate synthetase-like amidotransferase/phosphosugar isomerase protein
MCGIMGMALQKEHKIKDGTAIRQIFKRILIKSRIRGGDATGVAFVTMHKAVVFKHHIPAIDFTSTEFYENAATKYIDPQQISKDVGHGVPFIALGHTRAKTKGTYMDRNNNHPIVANRVVGVHNGVIGNDEELWSEYGTKLTRAGRVDSEIIFRLLDYHSNIERGSMKKAIQTMARETTGTYACAAVNLRFPWVLWLFKGYGPIYVYHFPEVGLILFASEKRFIEESIGDVELGAFEIIPFGKDEGLALNLEQNREGRFSLEKPMKPMNRLGAQGAD